MGVCPSPAGLSFCFPAISEMIFGILACKAILGLFSVKEPWLPMFSGQI